MQFEESAPIRKWGRIYWDGRVSLGNLLVVLGMLAAVGSWYVGQHDKISALSDRIGLNTYRIEQLESSQVQSRSEFREMVLDQRRVLGGRLDSIDHRLEVIDSKLDTKMDKPGR